MQLERSPTEKDTLPKFRRAMMAHLTEICDAEGPFLQHTDILI